MAEKTNMLQQAGRHKNNIIAETLLAEIESGTWIAGDRLPPERELSERFNCTRATLRSGLKQLELQNIIKRVPGSGTYVSDHIKPKQMLKNIAIIVIVNAHDLADDPHLTSALLGLHESTLKNTCTFQLVKLKSNESFFEHLKHQQLSLNDFDGLFFLSYFLDDAEVRKLKRLKKPFVGVAPTKSGIEKMSYVYIDNSEGIYLAASHLFELGKRNTFFFDVDLLEKFCPEDHKESAGFKRAALSYNMPNSDDRIFMLPVGDHYLAYQKMTQLIDEKRDIDSVVACGGVLAYGVCRAIRDAGLRIPEDIAVVMYNDFPWASNILKLPLTAVRPPYQQQAQKGLELLIRKIDTKDNSYSIEVLQPELCIRQSCGAKLLEK